MRIDIEGYKWRDIAARHCLKLMKNEPTLLEEEEEEEQQLLDDDEQHCRFARVRAFS